MDLQVGQRMSLSNISGNTQDTSIVTVTRVEHLECSGERGYLVFLHKEPEEHKQEIPRAVIDKCRRLAEAFGADFDQLMREREKNADDEYDLQPYWISEYQDFSYRLDLTGMPDAYRGKLVNAFRWDQYGDADLSYQMDLIDSYLMEFMGMFMPRSMGLYIYSHTKGSGKTLLACCIGNEIAKRYGVSVKFITAADYLGIVKDKNEEAKDAIKNCSLLILDDFGVQGDKDWITETFFALINKRNTNLCSTIITSNLPIENDKVDDRIVSRIYDMCYEVRLPEVSVRHRMADKNKNKMLEELMGGY